MIRKKKIALLFTTVVAIILAFIAGMFFGSKTKFEFDKKNKKDFYISFYSSKKFLGKELDNNEKRVLKTFIIPYEECFRNELNDNEKKIIKNIQKEVKDMSKNNDKVKFKVEDLKSVQNPNEARKAVFKIKKCSKRSYKQLNNSDKKTFRIAMLKLPISNVIDIFHGIK